MNAWLKRILIVAAVLAVLGLLLVGLLWMGPVAAVPKVDPLQVYLSAGTEEGRETAKRYADAFDALRAAPIEDWDNVGGRLDVDVPAFLAEWVRGNEGYCAAIMAAAQREACVFPLARTIGISGDETMLFPQLSALRTAAKVLMLRAREGLERGSTAETLEAVAAMDGLARHAYLYPSAIPYTLSAALRPLQAQIVLWPYMREDWPCEERLAYGRAVRAWLNLPGPAEEMLRGEREETCWSLRSLLKGHWFVPLRRMAGEYDRRLKPYFALVRLPLHEQFHFGAPERVAFDEAIKPRPRSTIGNLLNVPGMLADLLTPALGTTISLQLRAVAEVRGRLTVTAVFEHLDTHGEWPETLEALGEAFTVDPFTGQSFVYWRTAEGFTVYSAGYDRDDDGGRHHGKFGELTEREAAVSTVAPPPGQKQIYDGDFVFWPIAIDVSWGAR